MSYLVLSRKYRPQKFDEVIGQGHITQTLKNAISARRIAHAYLFAGPRGIGKTTTARIFAKALNCVKGPVPEPCQSCVPCKEIIQGISVDVFEIDAASNRGIDEIRALRENVKFAPAACRYKIYIIDEAHQITHDAFNALLKTLEEPPGHIIFILATTEPQKIPSTILSRCQRFNFRLVSVEEIVQRLEEIIKKENLAVEKEAITFIAHLAQGSVRDAESLLDEVVSFSPEEIKVKDIIFLLNLVPQEYLTRFGEAVLTLDKQAVLNLIAEINDAGYNLQQLVKDLREYFRQLLLVKFSPQAKVDLVLTTNDTLRKESEKFTPQLLSRYISLLSHCLEEMKWSDQPRIILEMYALRLASPYLEIDEILGRIENLEKSLTFEPDVPQPLAKNEEETLTGISNLQEEQVESPKEILRDEPRPCVQERGEPAVITPPAKQTELNPEEISLRWNKFLEEVKKNKVTLSSYLEFAQPKQLKDNVLTLLFSQKFYQEGTEKYRDYIEGSWEKMFGEKIKLNCLLGKIEESRKDILRDEEKSEIIEEPRVEVPVETFMVEENKKKTEKNFILEPVMKKILKHFPEARTIEKKDFDKLSPEGPKESSQK